eukprot:scaffold169_cov279-Chaetoceros_neogracile.AAC.16
MEQIVAVSVFHLAYVLEKTKLAKGGSFRMISTRQARYVVDRYVVSNVKEGEMLNIRVFYSRLSQLNTAALNDIGLTKHTQECLLLANPGDRTDIILSTYIEIKPAGPCAHVHQKF